MDDSQVVLTNAVPLYDILNIHYKATNGVSMPSRVYRYHLLDLGDTINLSQQFENSQGELMYVRHLITNGSQKPLLTYLVNVKTLILDNLSITNTYEVNGNTIQQLYFNNMTNLETLSLNGCSLLDEDIDLSNNLKLKSLDMRGTSINPILPENTIIEMLKLGTPTNVTLHGASRLHPSGVTVANSSNIDYIDIVNCGDNESFNIFGKVMNIES